MAARKIYFCGSIRGGRNDRNIYLQMIEHLQKFGSVLTEHVGSKDLTGKGENRLNDKEIHDRDMDWLTQSNAEVTQPSLGVGYEIGRAVSLDKKILCLFRATAENRLSAMIQGAENDQNFEVFHYHNVEDGCAKITEFFESLKSM